MSSIPLPPAFESDLAGLSFRPKDVKVHCAGLVRGQVLGLERDPTNPYDASAVKVMDGDLFLGFVQKFVAGPLAIWLDKGYEFGCIVKGLGHKEVPLLRIEPTGTINLDQVAKVSDHMVANQTADDDEIPF